MLSFVVGGLIVLALALGWYIQATNADLYAAKARTEELAARVKRLESVTHFPIDPPRSSFDLDVPNRKLTDKPR